MPRLGNLKQQKLVEVVFEAEGESVTMSVDKNAMTPNWMKRIAEGVGNDDPSRITDALAEIIVSWDVEDAQPTADVLGELPFEVLVKLEERLLEAIVPGSEEGNVSSEPVSSPAAASTPPAPSSAPNGDSSTSPASSASVLQT